ncbi:MAG: single-stranded DNA-binding protein [Thermoanaerobacteraceae bacterium]|nr:single-stranded DNA-binding protein [Thermoanaerobacteraceae bacterium]
MLNRVILIGRLTHDPELRYTASGVAVANFSIAVERPYTNAQGEREADFIRIVAWRKLAEVCANNLGKGRLVAIEGRIQVRSYENQEGERRHITEVVADDVRFLDWPKEQGKVADADLGGFDDLGTEVDDEVPF